MSCSLSPDAEQSPGTDTNTPSWTEDRRLRCRGGSTLAFLHWPGETGARGGDVLPRQNTGYVPLVERQVVDGPCVSGREVLWK